MGTPHLEAKSGEIADRVLLPGDPLRAKYIARNYLQEAQCYNQLRGMLGYTGMYKGKRISVQGTGMGIPSISIYVHELINVYGVRRLIRVGSCGAICADLNLRDLIVAISASTDSAFNQAIFGSGSYAASADPELFLSAWHKAADLGIKIQAGNVLSSDTFYNEKADFWKKWADYGVKCVEMETAGLYTLAARYKVQALSLLTVSDNIISGEHCSAIERQNSFDEMIKLGLEIV